MKLWRYGQVLENLGKRYRLGEVIGSGGMADICLAWDEQENRQVAIKVIKSDELKQKTLDRFLKEASHLATWEHPNILYVYSDLKLELLDVMHGSIVPYIVMEYAQGGDLQKRLQPKVPYPLADALAIFSQLCNAVVYAHERGMIHRDLKPMNVLFRVRADGSEQVVLSDFGLAVQTSATQQTFARAGTLFYMAPEQIQGKAQPASDIFALGVMLYQLCTGWLPFQRSLEDLRASELERMPPRPSFFEASLPMKLDDVLLVALAADPTQRFASATFFWEAVCAAVPGTREAAAQRAQGYIFPGRSQGYAGPQRAFLSSNNGQGDANRVPNSGIRVTLAQDASGSIRPASSPGLPPLPLSARVYPESSLHQSGSLPTSAEDANVRQTDANPRLDMVQSQRGDPEAYPAWLLDRQVSPPNEKVFGTLPREDSPPRIQVPPQAFSTSTSTSSSYSAEVANTPLLSSVPGQFNTPGNLEEVNRGLPPLRERLAAQADLNQGGQAMRGRLVQVFGSSQSEQATLKRRMIKKRLIIGGLCLFVLVLLLFFLFMNHALASSDPMLLVPTSSLGQHALSLAS